MKLPAVFKDHRFWMAVAAVLTLLSQGDNSGAIVALLGYFGVDVVSNHPAFQDKQN